MKKKDKKLLGIIIGVGSVLVLILVALFFITNQSEEVVEKEKAEDAWYDVPFDPSIMPTYEQVDEIMARAVTDTYGEEYWEQEYTTEMEFIEGTQISFDPSDFTDSRDRMALTVLAFQSNPYAITDAQPYALQRVAGNLETSVRELPDGTGIDLSQLVEEYTNMKYFNNREVPTRVKMQGYRNDEYFEDVVDLSDMYKEYYEETEGY